jgi:hypothetical protein
VALLVQVAEIWALIGVQCPGISGDDRDGGGDLECLIGTYFFLHGSETVLVCP